MPPIVKTFKAPDGKEFNTKSEWRDYMMTEYYSFKNKVNESLIKLPGTIDGQGFDIADCENSTLVVLDHSEQVQVDALKNCKVWISACSSSIFIRECENCTFYTCCRQLRLRDVKNCVFYIFSQAEVHIEFSTGLQFAPFNGSYPEHLAHIKAANLDLTHNMWYDVYDHNDPGKTRANWSLLPDSLYEPLWFPSTPCDLAVPRTAAGGVPKPVQEGENMQSFSLQQMMADAQAPPAAPTPTVTAPTAPTETLEQAAAGAVTPKKSAPSLPPSPPRVPKSDTPAVATPLTTSTGAGASDEDQVKVVLKLFVGCKAGEDISAIAHPSFSLILGDGHALSLSDMSAVAPLTGNELWSVERLVCAGDLAFASYWATVDTPGAAATTAGAGGVAHCTAVLQRAPCASFDWVLLHVQSSAVRPCAEAPTPFV